MKTEKTNRAIVKGKKINVYIPVKDNSSDTEFADELNPQFIFTLTHTELLIKILKGEINMYELAKKEMENRGLDINGNWVGFQNNNIEYSKIIK